MTRNQVARWATLAALGGGALFAYLVWAVPPQTAEGAANVPALAGAFLALAALAGGLGAIVALALHRRWPALAGVDRKRTGGATARATARPAVALRQGALVGVAAAALAGLSALEMLDPAFAIATLLLLGLVEAFWQSQDALKK